MKLRANDAVASAVSRMIDQDSPLSHGDLVTAFARFGLESGDPGKEDAQGRRIGKNRRVKGVLTYSVDHDPERGGRLIEHLLARLRGAGAFREASPTRLPDDVVEDARAVLRSEGLNLAADGTLTPTTLEGLSGTALTEALGLYVKRAREGVEDSALLAGTAKDLVEGTARHILVERAGGYQEHMNFPGTLFQAFVALGYPGITGKEIELRKQLSGDPIERFYQALYFLALVVNDLRNDQGAGHGRPFLPNVSNRDARAATEAMGLVAGLLLESL